MVNPISTMVLVPFISIPQVFGVLFWDNFAATVWSTLGMGLLFVSTYLVGISIAKNGRSASR